VTIQFLPGAVGGAGTVLVHEGEDPWAEILVQFERSRLEGQVDSYTRHESLDDFVFTDLPDDVTIALVAREN
jgi:hypothetical protein